MCVDKKTINVLKEVCAYIYITEIKHVMPFLKQKKEEEIKHVDCRTTNSK